MIKGYFTQHKDTGKWHQIEDVKDTGKPAHEGGGNLVKLKGLEEWVNPNKLKGMEPKMPMNKTDHISGGRAELAGKTKSDFDLDAIKVGAAVEMEHTKDKKIAETIAMDHLTEDKDYYKKLKEMEKSESIDPLELETGADLEMKLKGITNPDAAEDLARYFLNGDPDYYKRLRMELMGKTESNPLRDRWNMLKKSLDADRALIDLSQEETEEKPGDKEVLPESVEQPQEQPEQQEQPPTDEEISEMLKQAGYGEQEILHILGGHTPPAPTDEDIAQSHDQRMNQLQYDQEASKTDPEDEKAHAKRMRDEELTAQKKKNSQADLELEHRKKLQELEIEAKKKELEKEDPTSDIKKKQAELELSHKARMLDLEHKKAKKEADREDPTDEMKEKQLKFELEMKRKQIELELKYKEKELQLNLQLKAEAAKIKSQQQEESMAAAHKEKMKPKSEQEEQPEKKAEKL